MASIGSVRICIISLTATGPSYMTAQPVKVVATSMSLFREAVGARLNGAVMLQVYTVAGVPAAASYEGGLIYVSNETGGAVPAFSDGTNWRRVTDRVIVS